MRLTIKNKLLLSFGLIITVFSLLIVNYYILTQKLAENIREQVSSLGSNTDQLIGNAHQAGIYTLQCRRNEKDFLLRKKIKYLAKHDENMEHLLDNARNLSDAGKKSGKTEIYNKAEEILSHSNEYQKHFHQLVENEKTQGLDHNSGLQGKFRKIVHELSDIAKQFEVTDLERNYLLLRRWEKDYVRTNADKYKKRLLATLTKHNELLKDKHQNQEAAAKQSKAIKQYEMSFSKYVSAKEGMNSAEEDNSQFEKQLDTYYKSMREQAHEIESAIQSVFVENLSNNILTIRKHEKDFILRGSEKYVGKIKKLIDKMNATISQTKLNDGNKKILSTKLNQYLNGFLALVQAKKESVIIIAAMREDAHNIEPVVEEIITMIHDDHIKSLITLDNQVTENTNITLALTFFAVAASIALAFFLANKWSKTLVNLVKTFKTVGQGDFTCRSKVTSKDEIGDLGSEFNTLVSHLQKVISHVIATSKKLNNSATGITSTAAELSKGASDMSRQSTSVASATEEMATNMQYMAQSSEEMTERTSEVAASTQEMATILEDMAKKSEYGAKVASDAATKIQDNAERMTEFQKSANQIGSVVSVIQDIAEQTNLLALNATIEAARAGDAGKGFAVVATEVKLLASQTAQATEDISEKINAIQASTDESILATNDIREVILNVSEVSNALALSVQEQSIATREISKNTHECASVSSGVSTSVSESVLATQEITQNIVAVDVVVKQTAQSSIKTDQSGTQLNELSNELQDLVSKFKV